MPSIKRLCSTRYFNFSFLLLAVLVSLGGSLAWVGSCYLEGPLDQSRLTSVSPRFTPQWSPDGESIVFTFGDWKSGSTYIARTDGSSIQLASASSERSADIDFWPDISPDGSRLVYATTRHKVPGSLGCPTRNFEIETSRLDGSDRRRLTDHGLWDLSPAWSPDGASIAFARFRGCQPRNLRDDGGPGIFSIRPDGSGLRMISHFTESFIDYEFFSNDRHYQSGPVWSPDGKALAFVTQVEVAPAVDRRSRDYLLQDVLYTVGSDGAGLRRLFSTDNSDVDAILGTPAWSPDGLNIAFVTYLRSDYEYFLNIRSQGGRTRNVEPEYHGDVPLGLTLYAVGSDGSNLRELAYLGEGERPGEGEIPTRASYYGYFVADDLLSRLYYNPRLEWSRDGGAILLSDSQTVHLINTDGSGVRSHIAGAYGSWSPDNSRIAITTVKERQQDYSDEDPGIVLFTTAQDGSDRRILVRAGADDLIAENPTRRWWSWIPFFG